MAVDEIRELDRIADEEDGEVQTAHIVVSFLSVVLNGEAARISDDLRSTAVTSDSRKAAEHGGLLADLVQISRFGVFGDVVGHLEISMSTSATSMNAAFRDDLAVEIGHLVEEDIILQQEGSKSADGGGMLVIAYGAAE